MKVSLAILTLNEIEGVKEIVPRIQAKGLYEIFCIDGGSKDGTVEWLRKKGMRVVSQKNRGRADAVRQAFDVAKGDYVIIFSPDGNEVPEDIPKLIKKASEGYDMVIGSRFTKQSKAPDAGRMHAFGNKSITFFTNLLHGASVTDAINGFRIVRKSCYKKIGGLKATRHEGDVELTIKFAKAGFKIGEISTDEPPRIGGKAKIRTFTDGKLYMKTIFKEKLKGS